jgi:hypothetical protein
MAGRLLPHCLNRTLIPEDMTMTRTITTSHTMESAASTATDTKGTNALLAAGIVAGPLFVGVAVVQALTRAGFDPQRHPASLLSVGELGWIQIANFVVAGLLFVACAVGMRRALRLRAGRGATWGPRLIGTFGVSLIAGGMFVADPGLGFPPGRLRGSPTN